MQGDVQMSVSALLVLGDKANGLISDQIIEQWFASYIGEFKIHVKIIITLQVRMHCHQISGGAFIITMLICRSLDTL
jgi:hypothetical protein